MSIRRLFWDALSDLAPSYLDTLASSDWDASETSDWEDDLESELLDRLLLSEESI